ncbi:MAG: hypothetical protein K6E85_11820 [Lachnospiraceae bacterium]|nr:hypothetical protein [Lachnospiraceae bacterium]
MKDFEIGGIKWSELDKKRLRFEAVILGAAIAILIAGITMSAIRLAECLKIRTPHFLTSIGMTDGIEPGDYMKIEFDCSFDTMKYNGTKMYTLRLAGKNEYIYAEDPDPREGYWYFRDYGFFERPMESVSYTPPQPYTVIARAVRDRSSLERFRNELEHPEEFFGVKTYNVPNTVENTLFDYYFDRVNVVKVREGAYLWLFITAVGLAGTVFAIKWAINDQQTHMNFKRFEKNNERARTALDEFYTDRRKKAEKRRKLK